MKLKSLVVGTLVASASLIVAAISAPANAATISGSLKIDQPSGVKRILPNRINLDNSKDFFSVDSSSTGTFSGLTGSGVTFLRDLRFPLPSAYNLLRIEDGSPAGIIFRVTGLQNPTNSGTVGARQDFNSGLAGNFISGGEITPATLNSFLTAGFDRSNRSSSLQLSFNTASTTAVPTPALLPGLIGIGAAALRKRNSSEETSTEA